MLKRVVDSALSGRAMTSVTSAKDGTFTVTGLQTGGYVLTVIPPTVASESGPSANNMVGSFTVLVPSLQQLESSATTVHNTNQTFTYSVTVPLPRIGTSSITGKLETHPNSEAQGVPLTIRQVVLDFSKNPNTYYVIEGSTLSDGGSASKIAYWYPTYSVAGGLSTSSYLSATTDADGIFTFSNLPNIDYGGQLLDVEAVGASSAAPAATTMTAVLPDELDFSRNGLAAGKSVDISAKPLEASNSGASAHPLALLTTSTTDSQGNSTNNPATAVPIVLTFNRPILATLPDSPLVDATGKGVLATLTNTSLETEVPVTISGPTAVSPSATLTITPQDALSPTSSFTVNYEVMDATTTTATSPLEGSFCFSTLASSTPPVAITDFAIDTSFGGTSTFNYNTTSFPVTFTYNPAYTYTAQYAVTPAGATAQGPWTNAAVTIPSVSSGGSSAYGTVSSVGSWGSGDTLSLRLVESYGGGTTALGTNGTAVSNVVAITDQVAPTGCMLTSTSDFAVRNAQTASETDVGFGNTLNADSPSPQETGRSYMIVNAGMTDFTKLGATDNSTGTVFKYNGTTIADGTVTPTAGGAAIDAADIKKGTEYKITTLGTTTDFTALGAPAGYYVDTVFTASKDGGNGTAIGSERLTNFFTVELNPSEAMTVPKVVFVSTGTTTSEDGATITIRLNTSSGNPIAASDSLATVAVDIPAGKTVTGDSLSLVVRDRAGNQYQGKGLGGTIVQKIK